MKHRFRTGYTPLQERRLKASADAPSKRLGGLVTGHTLIELLVYAGLFVAISLASLDALLVISGAFSDFRATHAVDVSAVAILERLTREARAAATLDNAVGVYDASPGRVALLVPSVGATTTVTISISGGTVFVEENAGPMVPLSGETIVVDSLIFRAAAAATSTRAIKVELGLHDIRSRDASPRHFYTTALLRGTY